jgi:hypothetical protein
MGIAWKEIGGGSGDTQGLTQSTRGLVPCGECTPNNRTRPKTKFRPPNNWILPTLVSPFSTHECLPRSRRRPARSCLTAAPPLFDGDWGASLVSIGSAAAATSPLRAAQCWPPPPAGQAGRGEGRGTPAPVYTPPLPVRSCSVADRSRPSSGCCSLATRGYQDFEVPLYHDTV